MKSDQQIEKPFKILALIIILTVVCFCLLLFYFSIPTLVEKFSENTQDGYVKKVNILNLYTFPIISGNFEPTFYNNDKIFFKLVSDTTNLTRGTLVLYEIPSCRNLLKRGNCIYLSRIVGLPRETITIRNNSIDLNGNRLDEPYAQWRKYYENTNIDNSIYLLNEPITIPENQYFLLDDDRTWDDQDSRIFGPISNDKIIGAYSNTYYKDLYHSK
ncbi:signal peptidase I [Candidatus Gottesmanbacteria bacterium]|nr:signal peptidase I [Candidatus Gottesmanbacteria bacterium]